jgi:hypothetical protein
MMGHQEIRAVQHCEHLIVGDTPTDQMMVRKARNPGDPGVDLDLRIFLPDLGRDVMKNLAILADPDEHDREFHDAIIVGIEARGFEVNKCQASRIGRRTFGRIRIRPRNGPHNAVIRVSFEPPCDVLVFGIQVFDIHMILPFGSYPNQRGECRVFHTLFHSTRRFSRQVNLQISKLLNLSRRSGRLFLLRWQKKSSRSDGWS